MPFMQPSERPPPANVRPPAAPRRPRLLRRRVDACDNTGVTLISRISQTLGLESATAAPAAPAATLPEGLAVPEGADIAHVRILALNDFHGQLPDSTSEVGGVKIGGAATLAAYVKRERAGNPNGTVLVSAGDAMGASPPESQLLRHHSTMAVLEAMGMNLATWGNHEFDKGYDEAIRMIMGDPPGLPGGAGAAPRRRRRGAAGRADAAHGAKLAGKVPTGRAPWPGSPFPWVSCNVVDTKTGKPILPPYAIMEVNGVKVAFIGAVTSNLKNVTLASGIKNIKALDPATAVNSYIPEIQAKGVKAIVVVVHEGGEADPKDPTKVAGPIKDLAERLDPEVDVVASAHSHKEYATKIAGKVVTQAGSYGKALAEIDLAVDRKTGQVVASTSKLIRNDEAGIAPDPTVEGMVGSFEKAVRPKTSRVISVLPAPITRNGMSPAGETALGTLIAEAQRTYAKTDIALMNPGGIRQDLTEAGPVTWGTLFGVQPFANIVTRMELTGAEVLATLEQMFPTEGDPQVLQVAGMTVTMDLTKPVGHRIVKVVMNDGTPLDPKHTYTVAANSFIAEGGDGFTTLQKGRKRVEVGEDLTALVDYLKAGNPVPVKPIGTLLLAAGKLPEHTH